MLTTPYQSGYLPHTDGHDVYWQSFGNPEGAPVLFLHGGPGGGFEEAYLPLFDLNKVNLTTFDQRGCGQSKPMGLLDNNATNDLISDIERLRQFLNIEQWIVTGHSWGSTLAMAYVRAYPISCKAVCIAAFFGGTYEDQNWTFSGMRQFFPEEIDNLHHCRQSEDEDLPLDNWIYKNITSTNKSLREETAYCLMALETSCSQHKIETPAPANVTAELINVYKILFHYGKNAFFINPATFYDLSNLTVPVTLVHGQYDMDCPPLGAYRLKKALPSLDLRMVKTGNHSVFEDPMSTVYKNAIAEIIDIMH